VGEVIVDLTGPTSQHTAGESGHDIDYILEQLQERERSLEERRGCVPLP